MPDRGSTGFRTHRRQLLVWLFGVAVLTHPSIEAQEIGVGSGLQVHVLEAGHLLVDSDRSRDELFLGGVWAPAPPSVKSAGEYRGEDARAAVDRLLATHRVRVTSRWTVRGKTRIRLTVNRTAEDSGWPGMDLWAGSEDLAEWLARNGLAICDRPSAESREHADRICAAEREARQAHRGMHDGGYKTQLSDLWRTVDVGRLADSGPQRFYGPQFDTLFYFFLSPTDAPPPTWSGSTDPTGLPIQIQEHYPFKQ